MRTITMHQVKGEKFPIDIVVLDEPDPKSGACHRYNVEAKDEQERPVVEQYIGFQHGPVEEEGVNGISNEALIAIVIDRLDGLQTGRFPCDKNVEARILFRAGLGHLRTRTIDRLTRGVEGKNEA